MTRRSHTKPVLIGLFFAGVAAWAALLAAGCAGSNEPRDVELADTAADDRDAAGQSESPQAAPASGASDRAMGPPAGVQSVAPTAKADAGPAEVDAAPSTTASASRSQQREAEAASDGRPDWWLDEPVREGDRVLLTAEALARDVLSARRVAVEAGRKQLESLVGPRWSDERIELTTVRPLPQKAATPGGARFVGYVKISAVSEN